MGLSPKIASRCDPEKLRLWEGVGAAVGEADGGQAPIFNGGLGRATDIQASFGDTHRKRTHIL